MDAHKHLTNSTTDPSEWQVLRCSTDEILRTVMAMDAAEAVRNSGLPADAVYAREVDPQTTPAGVPEYQTFPGTDGEITLYGDHVYAQTIGSTTGHRIDLTPAQATILRDVLQGSTVRMAAGEWERLPGTDGAVQYGRSISDGLRYVRIGRVVVRFAEQDPTPQGCPDCPGAQGDRAANCPWFGVMRLQVADWSTLISKADDQRIVGLIGRSAQVLQNVGELIGLVLPDGVVINIVRRDRHNIVQVSLPDGQTFEDHSLTIVAA